MGRKSQYSKELKSIIVKKYLKCEESTVSLAKEINTTDTVVGRWITKHQVFGGFAFDIFSKNASYTTDFKKQVVSDYLNGGG